MIIEVILYCLIILTAYPVGLGLSKLCDDELKSDKKYFFRICVFLLFVAFLSVVLYYNFVFILSCFYMILVISILIYRSKK